LHTFYSELMLLQRTEHQITAQRSFGVSPQYVQTVLSCHGNSVFKYRNSSSVWLKLK